MAKTCCLACDKCYLDNLKQCPHCFTHNFFSDDDPAVVTAAVNVMVAEMRVLIADQNKVDQKTREDKLRELRCVAESLLPPEKRSPWYKRLFGF